MIFEKATGVLEKEHHVILKVVAEMLVVVDYLQSDQQIEPQLLQDLLKFMRVFVDKGHHQKEEAWLFPLLEKKGVPSRGCPIGVLLSEHTKGRGLVAEYEKACNAYSVDAQNSEALINILKTMSDFYPSHIWKEDYLLFPMADKLLSTEEQESLCAGFEQVELELDPAVYAGFERFAEWCNRPTRIEVQV